MVKPAFTAPGPDLQDIAGTSAAASAAQEGIGPTVDDAAGHAADAAILSSWREGHPHDLVNRTPSLYQPNRDSRISSHATPSLASA